MSIIVTIPFAFLAVHSSDWVTGIVWVLNIVDYQHGYIFFSAL